MEVANAMELTVQESDVSVGILGSMLMGKCSQTLEGTFLEVMELQNFPFDCQDFMLTMVFPASDEVFNMHPAIDQFECVRMTQDVKLLPEYAFSDPVLELGHTKFRQLNEEFSLVDVQHPTMVLRIKASRVWKGYVNKVVLTLSMVSLVVLFAFMIPHDDIADRLSHSVTLFLTAVAFQLVVSSSLPQLDYMTLIDKYILNLNMYFVFVMFNMAGVSFCQKHGVIDDNFIGSIDLYSMIASFLAWAGIHGFLVYQAVYATVYVENPKLKSFGTPGDRHGRQQKLSTNTQYSVVQDNSRIFFGNAGAYQAVTRSNEDFSFWSGTWCTEDFYGPHGKEYVFVSVLCDEQGQLQLMARKITGDPNVPCGRITWQTTGGVPRIGGPQIPCKVCNRMNVKDINGFSWRKGTACAVSVNELFLGTGTFRRQQPIDVAVQGACVGEVSPMTPLLNSQ